MTSIDELRKVLSYALAGGVAAIVDIGLFVAIYDFGESRFAAAASSFVIAAIFNYMMSSVWVFGRRPSYRHFLVFLCFASVGFVINVSITVMASTLTKLDPAAGKICGVTVAFAFNYTLNRVFVFNAGSVYPARST